MGCFLTALDFWDFSGMFTFSLSYRPDAASGKNWNKDSGEEWTMPHAEPKGPEVERACRLPMALEGLAKSSHICC